MTGQDWRLLRDRLEGLLEWLRQQAPGCFTEQAHLNEGSRERIYWHYGYMVALRDVLNFLTGRTPDKPN